MSGTGRLDSWKEIASYLRRGVRTAQRWERDAGLPVRRVTADGGAVYAFQSDIDAWWQRRGVDHRPPRSRPLATGAVPAPSDDTAFVVSAPAPHGTRVQAFLSSNVRVDPDSAPGHANLAVYFFTLTAMGLIDPAEGMPAARAAARRALALDPANSEAGALAALVLALYDHDWPNAERQFATAMTRTPVSALLRFHLATWYLSPLERHEESIVHLRAALAHEPLYLLGRVQIGTELCSLGRTEEGCAELEDVLGIDPGFGPALGHLGKERVLQGDVPAAETLSVRTYASIPEHPNAAGFRAGMLHVRGDHGAADEILERLARDSPWAVPRATAESHLVRGDFDAALECISAAVALHDPGIWILFAGTSGRRLRERPRWAAVRDMLRLPGRTA